MSTMATTVAPMGGGLAEFTAVRGVLLWPKAHGSLLSARKFHEVEKMKIRPVAIKAAPNK